MNKVARLAVVVVICAVAVGCTTTEKGAALGGLGGATLGGIIGHQSDHGVAGAAIGGAVGTVGGLLVGEHMDNKFCPNCGHQYPSDTKFCPVDGAELKDKQ